MPRIDGIELLRWLADMNANAKVIADAGSNPLLVKQPSAAPA